MLNNTSKYLIIRTIVYCSFVLIIAGNTHAQGIPDNLVLFKGRVLSADSMLAVPKAHLISKFNRWGSISDDDGNFKMYVSKYDSVLFTSVGFRSEIVHLDDSVMAKLDGDFTVSLRKDTVMINEIIIRAYYDYEVFKQMVISMEPLNISQFYPDFAGSELLYMEPTPTGFTGPVQLMYDWLNKSARLEKKLVRNRRAYNNLMLQMGRPSDTIPSTPEHMR